MSLIDRSFEEVCAIMDRTGDIVELLVEHATDFRMCDLFDENLPPGNSGNQSGPRRSGDGPVGLGLIAGKSEMFETILLPTIILVINSLNNGEITSTQIM